MKLDNEREDLVKLVKQKLEEQNKPKTFISYTIDEMNNIMNEMVLSESMVFSEDDDFSVADETEESPIEMKHPEEDRTNPNITRKIDLIRKSSLEGITELSNNPSHPAYDLFKKIWLMCDKLNNEEPKTDSE